MGGSRRLPSLRAALRWPAGALALLLLPAGLASCRIEVEAEEDIGLEPYVIRMLETSAAAWNRGDLDAFLSDYVAAASTTYVGGRGLVTGFEGIREVYAPAFAPGASRDSLRFEQIRVRPLPPLAGIVTARWILHDGEAITGSGPFTLVVRRVGTGWKIIHDHSSSDPAPPPAPASGPDEAAGAEPGAPEPGAASGG
jgi:ketosteroid isomerase-like protein